MKSIYFFRFFNTHVHGNGPSDATTYEPRLVLLNTVYDEFNVQNLTGTAQFEFEYSAISTPDRIKVEIVLIDDKHCQSPYHVQYFSVKANGDDEGLVESTSTFLIVSLWTFPKSISDPFHFPGFYSSDDNFGYLRNSMHVPVGDQKED